MRRNKKKLRRASRKYRPGEEKRVEFVRWACETFILHAGGGKVDFQDLLKGISQALEFHVDRAFLLNTLTSASDTFALHFEGREGRVWIRGGD